jgi:Ricin-type beta-trefoil lectin domain-like
VPRGTCEAGGATEAESRAAILNRDRDTHHNRGNVYPAEDGAESPIMPHSVRGRRRRAHLGQQRHIRPPLAARVGGSGEYKIQNYNSGLLLGVTSESKASGAQVLQWTDNGTADHLWTLTAS